MVSEWHTLDPDTKQTMVTTLRSSVVTLMQRLDLALCWPEVCVTLRLALIGMGMGGLAEDLPGVPFAADPQAWLDLGLMQGLAALMGDSPCCFAGCLHTVLHGNLLWDAAVACSVSSTGALWQQCG